MARTIADYLNVSGSIQRLQFKPRNYQTDDRFAAQIGIQKNCRSAPFNLYAAARKRIERDASGDEPRQFLSFDLMHVTLSGIVTLFNSLQDLNAQSPTIVTPSSISTILRLRHSRKASTPMLVTLPGIVTLVRPVQYLKALLPMLTTLSGIVMLVNKKVMLDYNPSIKPFLLITATSFIK